jgi:hypothetical protein
MRFSRIFIRRKSARRQSAKRYATFKMKDIKTSLKKAILDELNTFISENPNDKCYGVAIIPGQVGNYISVAFATTNGLEKVATEYYDPNKQTPKEQRLYGNIEKLKIWLKWFNPDDGWLYINLTEKHSELKLHLQKIVDEKDEDDIDEIIEKLCIQTLKDKEFSKMDMIFGVTYGEDKRDFLRTATMINTYKKVKSIWRDSFASDALDC